MRVVSTELRPDYNSLYLIWFK